MFISIAFCHVTPKCLYTIITIIIMITKSLNEFMKYQDGNGRLISIPMRLSKG